MKDLSKTVTNIVPFTSCVYCYGATFICDVMTITDHRLLLFHV